MVNNLNFFPLFGKERFSGPNLSIFNKLIKVMYKILVYNYEVICHLQNTIEIFTNDYIYINLHYICRCDNISTLIIVWAITKVFHWLRVSHVFFLNGWVRLYSTWIPTRTRSNILNLTQESNGTNFCIKYAFGLVTV